MSVRWSRIHASLGIEPADLAYKHIRDAVAQGVQEAEDLDWKLELPPKDERKLREFAKDVAAMANTRGGLIVFGVHEEDEKAVDLRGVNNNESQRQRLSNIAAARIQPLVVGLSIFALNGADDEPGVLVVSVPASGVAPHLIGTQCDIGIPFRHRSDTGWMNERDLERAYEGRFSRRRATMSALQEQREELVDQLELRQGAWLVLIARPTVAPPAVGPEPAAEDTRTSLTNAIQLAASMSADQAKAAILRELNDGANNPRVGLRRWIARSNPDGEPGDRSKWVHVELYHDGSSSFAACIEAWGDLKSADGVVKLRVPLIESSLIDAVALAAVHARHRGCDAAVSLEVDLARHGEPPAPMVAVDWRTRGGYVLTGDQIVPRSREVRRFVPAFAEARATGDGAALLRVARQLCQDVLHQFGARESDMTAPRS